MCFYFLFGFCKNHTDLVFFESSHEDWKHLVILIITFTFCVHWAKHDTIHATSSFCLFGFKRKVQNFKRSFIVSFLWVWNNILNLLHVLNFSKFSTLKWQISAVASNYQSIKFAVILYDKLYNLIELTNSTFTFPLILIFFNFFVTNMFSCFNILWTLFHDFEHFFVTLNIEGSAVLYTYIIQAFMVHACCKLFDEASKTAVIIINIMNSEVFDETCERVFKRFLLQNQYRNLKLRTSLFTINWKILMRVTIKLI